VVLPHLTLLLRSLPEQPPKGPHWLQQLLLLPQ
jgi:hypothetical protein